MSNPSSKVEQMREDVARADALKAQIDRLHNATCFSDLEPSELRKAFALGREALWNALTTEWLSLVQPEEHHVDSGDWELLCDIPECVGVFVGEGDDCGCQCPWGIFTDEETANEFIKWQNSLPDDEQRGDLHAMPLRFVEGELWNSYKDPDYDLPRVQRD